MPSNIAVILLVGIFGTPSILAYEELSRLIDLVIAGRHAALLTAGGVLGSGILYRVLCWYSDDFWSTAHHEIAHACIAMFVGGKPSRMLIDGAAGHLSWSVPSGRLSVGRRFLVLIAPYCLSPISVTLGVLLAIVPS